MYKSTAVRLISSGVRIKKSGDRLRRVQGMSKFVRSKQNPGKEDGNIITLRDPVATLCSLGGFRKLIVMFVDKLIDEEKKKVSFVRRGDAKAFLLGRPLSLVCIGSSLEVKIGEKSTSAESVGLLCTSAEIRCSVKMCTPDDVNINNERYEFSMGKLVEMFGALVVKVNDEKVKLPSTSITKGRKESYQSPQREVTWMTCLNA